MTLTVLRPGPLALLQDGGRRGHAADGVGRSGAADRASHARANLLVGNDPGAVAIEVTLGGFVVRAERDLTVAMTGAPAPADIDGDPAEHDTAVTLSQGQTLRLRAPKVGLRSYLAVAGGIDVPLVLGSASTDTLSKLGPAPLTKGDELRAQPGRRMGTSSGAGELPAPKSLLNGPIGRFHSSLPSGS